MCFAQENTNRNSVTSCSVTSIGILPVAALLLCEGCMALLRFLVARFVVKKNFIQNRTLFSL